MFRDAGPEAAFRAGKTAGPRRASRNRPLGWLSGVLLLSASPPHDFFQSLSRTSNSISTLISKDLAGKYHIASKR